jgi:copper homeostasis protein
MLLEICANSIQSAINAELGGADRIELCQQLSVGGLTPTAGLLEMARESIDIDIHVLIRPRAGDFHYSTLEFDMMKRDILRAKDSGADGIVSGVLLANGKIDLDRTLELVELTDPLPFIFHRAFDFTADLSEALETIIDSGATGVLTSGGRMTAPEGAAQLAKLVEQASNRIQIIVGSGLNSNNLKTVLETTGAKAFHASAKKPIPPRSQWVKAGLSVGDTGDAFQETSVAEVRALKAILG